MKSVLHKGFRWLFSKVRDSRLKTKMTLLVLLSVFVPLLVSTALFNSFSAENISRSQEQNAQNAYSQLLDLFSTRVDVVQQDICLLLQDANVRALLQSPVANWDFQKLPHDKAMMNTTFDYVLNEKIWNMSMKVYVPLERNILTDNRRIFPARQVENMDWYKKVVSEPYKKDWIVNDSEVSFLTDSPFSCVVRVCDPASILSTVSVIRFDFSAANIQQTLEQSLIGGECGAFLMTRDGEQIVGAKTLPESLVRQISETHVSKFGQWMTFEDSGNHYVARVETVASTPWRLAYAYRVMDVGKLIFSNRQWLVIIAITLLLGMAATIGALAFTKNMTEKVAMVSDGMTALKDGELKPLPRTRRQDEIGMLIESYNYLSDELVMLKNAQKLAAESQKHAEMVALQAQINPHFLYNTLEMINYYAMVGDAKQVERIVILLSRFYKRCLNHGNEYATVRDELELTRFYCEIQQIRNEDRIQFVFDVPEEMMQSLVPHLILQPLVENAIHHGILKKPDRSGTVRVTGKYDGDALCITVQDDGVGMTPERLKQLWEELEDVKANEESGSHYALRNINARLVSLYGPGAGLSYESAEGEGTAITIRLPVRT